MCIEQSARIPNLLHIICMLTSVLVFFLYQDETPLEEAKRLSEELGNTILLKREDLQPVHSFKVRGAFNRMSQMTEEQMEKGVICASAGNHAQGVALAALKLVQCFLSFECFAAGGLTAAGPQFVML